jgi:hypothetical protein
MRITPLILIALAGCGGASAPIDMGPDLAPNPNVCLGGNCVIVNTSHYNPDFSGTGTINTIKLPDKTVTQNLDATLDPDTAIHVVDGKVYILNQDTGTLRIYDPQTWKALAEISTGDASASNATAFPHDFFVSGTKVYVVFTGNKAQNAIGVLDTTMPNAGVVQWIMVPAAAGDTDGKPEAGGVFACLGKLYVTYADYMIVGQTVSYAGGGRIAVVDLATSTLESIIQLTGQNPGQLTLEDGSDCTQATSPAAAVPHALVVTSGKQTAPPDGTSGIERVDLVQKKSLGFALKDTDLNGRPTSIDVVSLNLAFVAIDFDPQMQPSGGGLELASAKVIAVNPLTGMVKGDVTGKAGFVNFARVSADKRFLFVGTGQFAGMSDPNKIATGVYVGPADGTLLPATPLDLGQTPAAIGFE